MSVRPWEAGDIFCPYTTSAVKSSNAVTNGNGTGTNNVFKWNRELQFVCSIQSSVYGATTVAKVSLFSTWTVYCKSYSIEIDRKLCNLAPKLTFT